MTSQLRVKSKGTFPYTYVGGDGLNKNSPQLGTEQMAFEQYVDPSGNTWVAIAGTAAFGGKDPGGLVVPVSVDAFGNIHTAPPSALAPGSAPSANSSAAYEASHLIKPTPGVLFGLSGYNSKSSAQFILLFDFGGMAVPPDTTSIPAVSPISVAATSNFSIDFGYWGMPFLAGIWVTNSSTAMTKTIGSADCSFTPRFV